MKTLKQFKKPEGSFYQNLAGRLESHFRNNAPGQNPALAKVSYGLESLEAGSGAEQILDDAESTVSDIVTPEVWENEEELTEGQKDAAVILMNASNDPASYHAQATATSSSIVGSDAMLDPTAVDVVAVESYDAREIEKTLATSIAFNLGAARQLPAMELFFPTISVTADQAGLTLNISRPMIHNQFMHDAKGAPVGELFNQRSLIDATIDSSILDNGATNIIPSYDNTLGIFDTDVGSFPVKHGNLEVKSGAFLFGQAFNLIGASANPLTDPFGVRDQTDTVDSLVRLSTVYLEVEAANGQKSIIPLDVKGLSQTQFLRATEGNDRQVNLQWSNQTYPIHGGLKDKDGVVATALSDLASGTYQDHVLFLKMSANGPLNLADGNAEVNAGTVSIFEIYKQELVNGVNELVKITDEAEITAIKALYTKFTLRSFTLDARYANLNRRERGLLVRQDHRRMKYMIPLHAPITALKPVTDTATEYSIDTAVQACRVFNTTDAVKALFEFDEFMFKYRSSNDRRNPVGDVGAIGTFILRPYYHRETFDVSTVVGNINSATRAEDISAALQLKLRDEFSKAIMISGYTAAQECLTGGGREAPTAAIVTDPRVVQFLTVKGDNRLFGEFYKTKVETSDYLEFRNKIFMTVRREASVQSPDGLNFGNMVWLPELSTNLPISRTGQISHEFTIQPRRRHIISCPILIRIDLEGLDKVVNNRVPVSIVQ